MFKLIRKLLTPSVRPPATGLGPFRSSMPTPVAPEAVNRAPTPDWDIGLIPHAQRWLERLPAEMRPTQLCLAFPRIGNRISLLWPSASLVDGYFEDLLIDKRGGRRGFPDGIPEEIIRLRDFRRQDGDVPDTFFGEPDPVVGHGVSAAVGSPMERTTPGFQARF